MIIVNSQNDQYRMVKMTI